MLITPSHSILYNKQEMKGKGATILFSKGFPRFPVTAVIPNKEGFLLNKLAPTTGQGKGEREPIFCQYLPVIYITQRTQIPCSIKVLSTQTGSGSLEYLGRVSLCSNWRQNLRPSSHKSGNLQLSHGSHPNVGQFCLFLIPNILCF